MAKPRNLIHWAIAALASVIAFEVFSYLILVMFFGVADLRRLPAAFADQDTMGRFDFSQVGVKDMWQFEEAHPYFGFRLTERWAGLKNSYPPNNHGFRSRVDYPYEKKPGEYVIGVFGGSVAQFFTEEMSTSEVFQNELRKRIPRLRDKKIVLLNFALGGGKQPQQFIISTFFHDTVDFVMNLEGFSELVIEVPQAFPEDYPLISDFLYGEKIQSLPYVARIENMKRVGDLLVRPVKRLPLLGYSPTLGLLHRALRQWTGHRALALQNELKEHLSQAQKPFRYPSGVREDHTEIWRKFTWRQHKFLQAMDKPHVTLIQPVLGYRYLANAQEREWLKSVEGLGHIFENFEKDVADQRKRGVPIIGLFDAFEKSHDVYRDVAHLNQKGNNELAVVIAERIAPYIK